MPNNPRGRPARLPQPSGVARALTRLSMPRRSLLAALGLTLLAAPLGGLQASAQMADLKIMAPASPGGGWDQTARSMQQALVSTGLARSVQVVNVTGAGGTIGLAQFINGSKGDPNQLMVMGFVMVGAILTNKAPVSLDQVTPIARLTEETEAIAVPVTSPLKTVQELAAAIKENPGKVTWAGGSAGGTDHIAAALFAQAAGADPAKINYIPFSGGGEALAAVLGGKVTAGISGYGEFESQVKAGKLRILAITAKQRIAGIDAPTLTEAGIALQITNWRGVVAPPGITSEQRDTLVGLVEKMAKSPAWADVLKQKGWDDALMTGDSFATFLKDENARTTTVLKSVGLVKP